MPSTFSHRRLSLVVFLACVSLATEARAVSRSCGPDPIANTTNVLCASGTCTAALVRVTTAIEVTDAGCEFDLGGRALSIERNFQMTGAGFIKVSNAGNITLTSTGRLNARGDFVQPNGFIIQGGLISLTSAGVITMGGQIDVTGDSAGTVRLVAAGDVNIQGNSSITGRGISSFPDLGMLFTDGGELDVVATAGNVTISGDLVLSGANQGTGGIVDLTAGRTITVNRSVDVSGGGGDGGEFDAIAGDDIVINNGTIDCDSSLGGGFGGLIDLTSGADELGGIATGGDVLITSASLVLRGSNADQFAGDGGEVDVLALGDIKLAGAGMVIRADAGTNFDGSGGTVSLDSGDPDFFVLGPNDGDILVTGIVSLNGGSTGGDGGTFEASAGRDLTITATINAGGVDSGGEIDGDAGRAIVLGSALSADATGTTGDGGVMDFEAGVATDAGGVGTLSIQKNLDASGGSGNASRQSISLAGCGLSVSSSVKIDGTAGTSLNGVDGGAAIDLIARRPMQLGNNSQYLAAPGGVVTTIHPAGAIPVIGSGVTFNPPRVDSVIASGPYPNCPVCGDGIRQLGEVCDKGAGADGACCNATCSQFLCVTPTPTPQRTATHTPTPTHTATPTSTATTIPTVTTTVVPAATGTAGPAATATPTAVATAARTVTPVPTATTTPVASVTATAAPTSTPSATGTAVATVTALPTATASATATAAPTSTATATSGVTSTPSATPTTVPAPPTATGAPAPTATASATPLPTTTASVTATPAPTTTASITPTATGTAAPTATPTISASPTATVAATATGGPTTTASVTPTIAATESPTATATAVATSTASATPLPSVTPTLVPTTTVTATPIATLTTTPTVTPALATPTIALTPTPAPTSGACGAHGDSDGDGVCDDADNCPNVANADQGDLDADGTGNACDDVDAALDVHRARVHAAKGGTGDILAKGELETGADAPFDPALGLEVEILDTLTLDRTMTFAATDCRTLKSGRVTCRTSDGRAAARFEPLRAKPGRVRFDLKFRALALTEPFAPALLVRLTTDPASAVAGIDRVGSLDTCRVTTRALLCLAKP